MRYIVETRVGNTFENTWTEDDAPCVFDSRGEAIQALAELAMVLTDFDREDYKIVEIDQ